MFENQIVAVTGASGGIGRALAEMFVASGATVAISDLNKMSEMNMGGLMFISQTQV